MRYPKLLALFLFLMSIGVPKIQSQDNAMKPATLMARKRIGSSKWTISNDLQLTDMTFRTA